VDQARGRGWVATIWVMHTKSMIALCALLLLGCDSEDPAEPATERIAEDVELSQWGPDDELGNANYLGKATRQRCALSLLLPQAKVYELGHEHSSTMPQSPFATEPFGLEPQPTAAIPFARHAANEESISGIIAHQGTQLDALGHFGRLGSIWFGEGPIPSETATYYNGFTQAEVKPDPTGGLERLGVEQIPPIVTTAVVLDAQEWFGESMEAGQLVTKDDIVGMLLSDLRLKLRGGILPGDAVYIRTGWGELWEDPSPAGSGYYLEGPGLSVDAAQYIASRGAVIVGLDNPFTDPAQLCGGQLCGACIDGMCGQQPGTEPGLPFGVHDYNLAVAGVLQIQNMDLTEIADDDVAVACTMVLPLRMTGASGSPVRPVAIGK
jgi:kynurenine formamidase